MRTRLGLKVLGLSALVMGVMAIGTTGVAQAEVGACWGYLITVAEKLELKCFSATLEAKLLLELEEEKVGAGKTGTLLIANKNIEILCTGAEFDEGGQLAANGSILLGRLKFTGCIARERGAPLGELKLLPLCEPVDPISGKGVILTEKFTGLIILHKLTSGAVDALLKLSPDNINLALAVIHTGELCGAGEEIIVSGHLDLEDAGGRASFEEHKLVHLLKESSLHLLFVGVNAATLDGTANVTLATPHNALKWAGKPA